MIVKEINGYTKMVTAKVRKIGIFLTGMKTVKQWYDLQSDKPDIVCNCGFFCWSGNKHEPCYSLKVNYEYLTTDSLHQGLGIKDNKAFIDNIQNSSYKDFVSGVPVILQNGENKITKAWIDMLETISGKEPRTIFGFTDDTVSVLCIDGRRKDKLGAYLQELPKICSDNGLKNAINLDGGGSCMTIVDGKIFNSPSEHRPVHNVLAIWVEKENEDMDWKEPNWNWIWTKYAQVDVNGKIKVQNNDKNTAIMNASSSGYAVWEKETRTRIYPEVVVENKPQNNSDEKEFLLNLKALIDERLGKL